MAKKKAKSKSKRPMMKAKPKRTVKAKPVKRAAGRKVARPAASAVARATTISKALAPGYNWVNAYLTVRDVEASIRFYRDAFGFKVRFTMPGPEGKIQHAEMTHNDSVIMLGPENPQMGAFGPQGVSPVTLYLYVEDVDQVAARAVNNGAKLMKPPADEFWGDRCCILTDPQGHLWMLATHYKDVSPEEMRPPSRPPTM